MCDEEEDNNDDRSSISITGESSLVFAGTRSTSSTTTTGSGLNPFVYLQDDTLSSSISSSPARVITQQQADDDNEGVHDETTASRIQHQNDNVAEDDENNDTTIIKTLYMIRHGESLGQVAKNESIRRNDQSLLDCSLSSTGIEQAENLYQQLVSSTIYDTIELVICSPLTRAIQTAILVFPTKPIIIHYELREIGTFIPENIPRPMRDVIKELKQLHPELETTIKNNIDYMTLRPADDWPKNHMVTPKVIRRDKIRNQVFQEYIGIIRPDRTIAVVCHYHVIRAALTPTTALKITKSTTKTPGNSPTKNKNQQSVMTPIPKKRLGSINATTYSTPSRTKPPPANTPSNTTIDRKTSSSPSSIQQQKRSKSDLTLAAPIQTPSSIQKRNSLLKTPSTPYSIVDINPRNAIPIKCYLNTETGELILADEDAA